MLIACGGGGRFTRDVSWALRGSGGTGITPFMSENFTVVLDKDWFGAPVAARPSFELKCADGFVTLRAHVAKAPLVVPGDTGGFVEGLWEGDCAELFLSNPETGYYVEFNLSPQGAWWCCGFSARRTREASGPRELAGVTTTGETFSDRWSAGIRIPVASLPAELAFGTATTRGNVTFCLGNDPQRYLTFVDLGGGKPDFHLPEKWIPLFLEK